jgi:predicted glycosyl hydrolase (DUF1957 family)
MKFPQQIETFLLHDVFGHWTFKGKEFVSAHYIRLGSRMNLYIRTIGDQDGNVKYEIQLRDSYITNIDSLETALSLAKEIIIENNGFV